MWCKCTTYRLLYYCIMKKIVILILLFFYLIKGITQVYTGKGNLFTTVSPLNIANVVPDKSFSETSIFISSETNNKVNIKAPFINFDTTVYFSIPSVKRIRINYLNAIVTEGIHNRPIIITSNNPVTCYILAGSKGFANSNASLLIPDKFAAKNFTTIGSKILSSAGDTKSFFTVISHEDFLPITIHLKDTSSQNLYPNTNYNYVLQKNEALHIVGKDGIFIFPNLVDTISNLSGSKIFTTNGCSKKFSVVSGNTTGIVGCNTFGGLGSSLGFSNQIPPYTLWYKQAFTVPTKLMYFNMFRVMVNDVNTVVKRNGIILTDLVNNSYYDFLSNTADVITADKPILLVQFITNAGQCGNPLYIIPGLLSVATMGCLSGSNQFIQNATFTSFPFAETYKPIDRALDTLLYLNVVTTTADTAKLLFDGKKPVGFTPYTGNATYSHITISTDSGTHRIVSPAGFNAYNYGYRFGSTIFYNIGIGFKDPKQFIYLQHPTLKTHISYACVGSPMQVRIHSPYRADTIRYYPKGGTAPVLTYTPTLPDSAYMQDGDSIYVYTYPNTYQYDSAGSYDIRAEVYNGQGLYDGCPGQYDELNASLTIGPKATPGFTYRYNGCPADTLYFTDTTNSYGIPLYKWKWQFGDGRTDSIPNPNHVYNTPGTYTIRLSTETLNNCGIPDTAKAVVTILPKTTNRFSITGPACVGKPIQFNDSSSHPLYAISKWWWAFGDGSTDTLQNPKHSYAAAGNYTLKLVTTTANGCLSDTLIRVLRVGNNPIAAFTLSPAACVGRAGIFTNSTTINPTDTLQQYHWYFGNGDSSNVTNPTYTYPAAGSYTVRLQASTTLGCTDTASKIIVVQSKPKAAFGIMGNLCEQQPLLLTDSSRNNSGSITQWRWAFGNGRTDSITKPVFTYTNYGKYNVQLTVATANGCADTAYKTIEVQSQPVVNFSTDSSCVGKPVQFTNNSRNTLGSITAYNWAFGNGQTSSLPSPTVTYNSAGTYRVSLRAFTSNGCTQAKDTSLVLLPVAINAGPNLTAAIGQPIQLQVTGGQSYLWQPPLFLNSNQIANPIATLNNDITYYITGTTAAGCTGYDTLSIKVYQGPMVYVPTAFTPNNDGKNDRLKPVCIGITELKNFTLFNRWGQKIYETATCGSTGWDGRINGELQPAGTYVYQWQAVGYNGKVLSGKGVVVLVR